MRPRREHQRREKEGEKKRISLAKPVVLPRTHTRKAASMTGAWYRRLRGERRPQVSTTFTLDKVRAYLEKGGEGGGASSPRSRGGQLLHFFTRREGGGRNGNNICLSSSTSSRRLYLYLQPRFREKRRREKREEGDSGVSYFTVTVFFLFSAAARGGRKERGKGKESPRKRYFFSNTFSSCWKRWRTGCQRKEGKKIVMVGSEAPWLYSSLCYRKSKRKGKKLTVLPSISLSERGGGGEKGRERKETPVCKGPHLPLLFFARITKGRGEGEGTVMPIDLFLGRKGKGESRSQGVEFVTKGRGEMRTAAG